MHAVFGREWGDVCIVKLRDAAGRNLLQDLVSDYTGGKQQSLVQMKKGQMTKATFLEEAGNHILTYYQMNGEDAQALLAQFEQYIFGYSILSTLIDDPSVSDIRVISYDNIRVKREGRRMSSDMAFASPEEYRQFVDYVATRNQVNISNLNAIGRFTDDDSHPEFILRFTLSMPLVNSYHEPYLCIRKIPKRFPQMKDLIAAGMLDRTTAELLVTRFRSGSTLICGGNSSGKTTLLNALKETLPDDVAVLIAQQADELTTYFHPDMMFLHSLPGNAEQQVSYGLEEISIAGLTMDVDFFIIGEVKGGEAIYLLNAAYTGQLCAATIHAPGAYKAPEKLVDYAMQGSRYSRDELMKFMECFQTLVFMKHYKVAEVYACNGWDGERKSLRYEKIYERNTE